MLKISQQFVNLLDQLSLPQSIQTQFHQYKQLLINNDSEDNWFYVLSEIIQLIQQQYDQNSLEKANLEQFFNHLNQYLQEIEQQLALSHKQWQLSVSDCSELYQSVYEQVEELDDEIKLQPEIIKQQLSHKLQSIRSSLMQQLAYSEQQSQSTQTQLNELTEKLQTLEIEAQQLRIYLQLEQKKAYLDILTGLPNRLAYNEKIVEEFSRWKRYQNHLSLAICDIDYFKNINDTYGHQVGDQALCYIASLLNRSFRKTDFVARYGGEEFVIILVETPKTVAFPVMEKMRTKIFQKPFCYQNHTIPITLSFGITEFTSKDEIATAFDRADKALYQAKNQGRNQSIQL